MADTHSNYVDGEWIEADSGETFEVRNPADTDEVVAHYQGSGPEDAERAIEAAAGAQQEWADTPGPARGRVLTRTAEELEAREDELTELLVREEGKARGEAAGEVGRAIDIFRYYATKARDRGGEVKPSSSQDTTLYTVDEPVGVVSLVTPWNYPIAIPAWKLAPALATGNTAVLKPASLAPGPARAIVEALDEAGVPDGVVNFVTGSGSDVGDPLTTHDDVDAVSFTGSANVGEQVYEDATAADKRAQTEMGGKNPTVVTANADVEEAVEIVGSGAFGVTGQACTACSRAVVHESVYDEFVEGIVEYAEGIEVGPGLDGGEMGPQVSEDELETTLDYIEVGENEGANLATGGERAEDGSLGDGYFVEPTVFTEVEHDMRIAQEEIFGPVLSVIRVDDFDEGVEVANGVEYGLSSSVVTRDLGEANRFIDRAEAGITKVNEKTTGVELHTPFGGFKRSSSETWREQGDAGLDFYTITKTVYVNY